MFKNSLSDVFPVLHRIYDLTELILVGSNISDWLDILQKSDVEKVHYINQASLDYRFETLPPNWEVTTKLLAQENGEIMHYTLTNSMLNGTVDSKVLAKLWTNLETLATTQKEAVSLKSFTEDKCIPNSSKILVVDSFDGLHILNDLSSLDVNVVAIRVIASDEDEFNFVSQRRVNQKLIEWGYKNIATYEDNHPKIKTLVYVKNTQQQIKQLSEITIRLENKIKELTNTKDSKEQELLKLKTELENKTKELQENINKESVATESLQKELTSLKESKEQELLKLKTELENKTKVINDLKKDLKSKIENIEYSDANIDNFIKDLVPFYYGKSLNYVDIGAYHGEVFLKFKKHLQIREAHLFEPDPKNFQKLTENISEMNLPKLKLYNFALGDKKKTVTFSSSNSMSKQIDFHMKIENTNDYFESKLYKLNSFRKAFTDKHINILKIDVEGSELNVLKGADKILRKHEVDILYIEVGFNHNSFQQTYFTIIDDFLQQYGYRVFKIYEQMNEWIDDSPLLRRCNFAYMNEKFATQNSYKLVQENYKLKAKLNNIEEKNIDEKD